MLCAAALLFLTASCDEAGSGGSTNYVNEGSTSNFISLTLDATHSGTVAADGASYYTFTTGAAGTYNIALTNLQSDLSWDLFSDSSLATSTPPWEMHQDGTYDSGDEISDTDDPLAETTQYWIRVDEYDGIAGSFSLLVSSP